MYGRMDLAKRQLIIELLDETAPLEFVPQRKRSSQADTAISFYDRPEMQIASEEPQQMNSDFLERLSQSESSGDSHAEITIAGGRRYVGALHSGMLGCRITRKLLALRSPRMSLKRIAHCRTK